MELTLRYSGVLYSANGQNKIAEKHRVRQDLSKQLEQFWMNDPRLDGMYKDWGSLQKPSFSKDKFVVSRPLENNTGFWWRWPLCGYQYIPLLTDVQGTVCELDIRLYRRLDEDGVLFEGGDIDNRLKVFLDALQVPKDQSQVPNPTTDDNNPDSWPAIFCLLDDDRAVTKLSITSHKLLTEVPEKHQDKQNYVELHVDVTIVPITPMVGTWMLTHR